LILSLNHQKKGWIFWEYEAGWFWNSMRPPDQQGKGDRDSCP